MNPPASKPPSIRAFLAGVTGSGKSFTAWRVYLQHYPRIICLDPMDEWSDSNPESGFPGADASTYGLDDFATALQDLAPKGEWIITASVEGDDVKRLVDYLVPIPNVNDSPVLAVGGCAILVDEVDLIAPSHSQRIEARTLWRRSRHAGLSVISTTQRPESVSREVSSQSQQLLCLQLTEPAAFDYMEAAMHVSLRPALIEWTRKHPHGGLWRDVRTGETKWYDGERFLTTPVRALEAAQAPRAVREEQQRGQAQARRPDGSADDGSSSSLAQAEPVAE